MNRNFRSTNKDKSHDDLMRYAGSYGGYLPDAPKKTLWQKFKQWVKKFIGLDRY